jgi:hypothetical protein
VEFHDCPHRLIPPEVIEMARLAEDAKAGIPPVAGGSLDQTLAFNQARTQLRYDDAMWQLEREKTRNPHGRH